MKYFQTNRIIQNENSIANTIKRLEPFVHAMTKYLREKNFFGDFNRDFRTFGRIIAIISSVFILLQYYAGNTFSIGNVLTVITLVSFLGSNFEFIISHLVLLKTFKIYQNDYAKIKEYEDFTIIRKPLSERFNHTTIDNYKVIRDSRVILNIVTPLTFRKGEKVCILGLSGAGKTTFVSLFEDANLEYRKIISINGIYRNNIDTIEYKKLVRISFQENTIMSGKGYDDWFQKDNISSEVARSVLKKLRLPDDVVRGARYLHSYESNISGGEAKRLNIARLLVRPGDINIFDEPTNGLNPSLAREVWEAIFTELSDKTVICTTHDLNYLERFERVIVIDDGKIVADTDPKSLAASPDFARIKDNI